jgi:hypothetical protein
VAEDGDVAGGRSQGGDSSRTETYLMLKNSGNLAYDSALFAELHPHHSVVIESRQTPLSVAKRTN